MHATKTACGCRDREFRPGACNKLLTGHERLTRARVEISEQPGPIEVGGKAQGQAFRPAPERRTVAVTSNGSQVAVVSGIDQLTIMRTSGFAPTRKGAPDRDASGVDDGLQPLLVATLTAQWTYSSPDVTFGPYRQGVRAAIVETFGCHATRSVQHTLYQIAEVVLSSYEELTDITLSLQERPYRLADPFSGGVAHPDRPDDLFVAIEEPVGIVEVTVERDKRAISD